MKFYVFEPVIKNKISIKASSRIAQVVDDNDNWSLDKASCVKQKTHLLSLLTSLPHISRLIFNMGKLTSN